MDTLGAVTNLRNCPIFDVCPYCVLRHPYGGKRILRSPHQKIFCENGIGNYDTIPIQYEKRTSKNSSVINENDKNNFRIFYGSLSTDGERYDSAYAFSTEAKDIKSFENSDNLKLVPETNHQV